MIVTVWPGRALCVWSGGKLIAEVALTEPQARAMVRQLMAGWDEPPVTARGGFHDADV